VLWSIIPPVGTVRAFWFRLHLHVVQVLVKIAMAIQHLCEVKVYLCMTAVHLLIQVTIRVRVHSPFSTCGSNNSLYTERIDENLRIWPFYPTDLLRFFFFFFKRKVFMWRYLINHWDTLNGDLMRRYFLGWPKESHGWKRGFPHTGKSLSEVFVRDAILSFNFEFWISNSKSTWKDKKNQVNLIS